MTTTADFLVFAHELADCAREITLNYFRKPIIAERKDDSSPVTIADKETEQRLREKITHRFPKHGIIGEEQTAIVADSPYEWIIDPIDGTKNFIAGYPLFGTLICLLENGQPIVSVIDVPAQNERFYATAHAPTCYRKRQHEQTITTRTTPTLSDAVLCSTDDNMFSDKQRRQITPLREAVSTIRYNGDCYLYAMLAAGWIDVVIEADLKIYDFLPLVLIIEQAGGIITDWQGKPLTKHSNGQVLACANTTLHHESLAIIQP